MMRHAALASLIWLPLAMLAAHPGWSSEASQGHVHTIVLKEHLDKQWTDEPLSYPFEAEQGACHIDSLHLDGPAGGLPVQLADVELWPGTRTIQSATVWFVADLAPLAENVYTLTCDSEPRDGEPVRAELDVSMSDDRLEMVSAGFGVGLRLGKETYDQPREASDVPGPIRRLRLADGTWFGGSDFDGPTRISAWSAEVTAEGPVFGEVRYRYSYEDGNVLDLAVRLFARSDRVQFDTDVAQHSPDDALRINLSRDLPPLTLHVQRLFHHRRDIYPDDSRVGDWFELPLSELESHPPMRGNFPSGLVQWVSSWGPWWDDLFMPVVRLGIGDGERELHVARRDPAAWVEPRDEPWTPGGDDIEAAWEPWQSKNLPIIRTPDGETWIIHDFKAGQVGGVRRFDIADSEATEDVGWRPHRRDLGGGRAGAQVIPYPTPLNQVKDYILDWPQQTEHPRLFMSEQEITESRPEQMNEELLDWLRARAGSEGGDVPHSRDERALAMWLLTGNDDLARELHLPDRLKRFVGSLGDFDKMRSTVSVAALYDALINSDLITSQERRVLRAQMAYLAYQINDVSTWDARRGWMAANMTMTFSYSMLAPAVMASVLNDHPEAETWAVPALLMLEDALDVIHPSGQWPESSHYGSLGISRLLTMAIMATQADFGDYISDERLKRAVIYYQAIRTPPDPRVDGMREFIRYGRHGLQPHALEGLWASAIRDVYPETSRRLQWFWRERLEAAPFSRAWDNLSPGLGGFEYVYINDALPAQEPDWHTQRFPEMGVIFRHGFGTDHEHHHALISGDHWTTIYPAQTGGLVSLFAHGRPVAGSFLNGNMYQAEFLINRVSLARDPADYIPRETPFHFRGDPQGKMTFDDRPRTDFTSQTEGGSRLSGFANLPRQDYATVDVLMKVPKTTGNPPLDDLPWPELLAGEGEPPLWWRRQTMFIKDDDPTGVSYLLMRDTVKGDQPTMWTFWTASQTLVASEEAADRSALLTEAPGDVIIEPSELSGNRFTALGQWDVDLEYYIAAPTDTPRHTLRWGRTWNIGPMHGVAQYQDLLHLQRADDGVYYVALFPRKADDPGPPPRFSTLGQGTVIKVEGTFGTDWSFLAAEHTEARADDLRFTGTAASVQLRNGETVVSLGAAGRVSTGTVCIQADHPASVRWQGEPGEPAGSVFHVELPPDHEGAQFHLDLPADRYASDHDTVTLEHVSEALFITVPATVTAFTLERE